MNFKLIEGLTSTTNLKPTLRDINNAIDLLDSDTVDAFIILEPSEKIEETVFIKTLLTNSFVDGSFELYNRNSDWRYKKQCVQAVSKRRYKRKGSY